MSRCVCVCVCVCVWCVRANVCVMFVRDDKNYVTSTIFVKLLLL